MRVRLAPGVTPQQAIAEIKSLAGGKGAAVRAGNTDPISQRIEYVRWSTNVEARVANLISRADAQVLFDTPRHRDICSMIPDNHITTLIYAEIDVKAQSLEETARHLESFHNRMLAAPGFPVVVDTNVLLQCQRLDNVNWRAELADEARILLPLRVVEEIDAKKYGDSKRLRSIARELLPWIDGLFPTGDPGPVPLRDDATIELPLAERPRFRPADADEEILDLAHDVTQFTGRAKVLTADTGMRIRARSEGLDVLVVPDGWRRPVGDS